MWVGAASDPMDSSERGVMPGVAAVEVRQPPEGWVPGPPPHSRPAVPKSIDPGLHPINDQGDLHPETRRAAEALRRPAQRGDRRDGALVPLFDYANRSVLRDPPALETLTTCQQHDYVALAAAEHAYWFCVYDHPCSADQLERRMASPDAAVRALARTEISKECLLELLGAGKFRGLEIIKHHTPNYTLGVVVDARFDDRTQQLQVLMRPHASPEGRSLSQLVEFGVMRGCSLSHCVAYNKIQFHEVSLCYVGARPHTRFLYAVRLPSVELPRTLHSRYFQPPVYHASTPLRVSVPRTTATPTHTCLALQRHRPMELSVIPVEVAGQVLWHNQQRQQARAADHARLVTNYNRF